MKSRAKRDKMKAAKILRNTLCKYQKRVILDTVCVCLRNFEKHVYTRIVVAPGIWNVLIFVPECNVYMLLVSLFVSVRNFYVLLVPLFIPERNIHMLFVLLSFRNAEEKNKNKNQLNKYNKNFIQIFFFNEGRCKENVFL